ncbi:MAG: DUF1669 domain-containing protein [Prevotella sp.]|nr:DUF1669 domain-containing protein [Prevotella sp.]
MQSLQKLIHNKFCIFDDEIVIDGSYNWTILAERNNDENIVVIEHGNVVSSFKKAFENLLKNNTQVYAMPDRVPERPEYDCCSYRFYNSEEWSEALSGNLGKNRKRRLYKELYEILPEESAKEKIPSQIFDEIKNEVEEEKTRDLNLFNSILNQNTDELNKQLSIKEKKIASVERKTESLSEKKSNEIEKYRSRLATIQSRKISQEQKKQSY